MSCAIFKKNMPVSIILRSCYWLPAGLFEIARQMCLLSQQQTTLGRAAEDNNMSGAICDEHHTQHTDANVKLLSSSVSISVALLPAGLVKIARQMYLLFQQQTTIERAAEENNMSGAICDEPYTQHKDAHMKPLSILASSSV